MSIIEKYKRYSHSRKRLESFFSWLQSRENNAVKVQVVHPWRTHYLQVSNAAIKKIGAGDVDFIVYDNDALVRTSEPPLPNKEQWFNIYTSPTLKILENKGRHGGSLPLRFGLSDTEKKRLLGAARYIMQEFIDANAIPKTPEPLRSVRYAEKYAVDIALWINGENRGSRISYGQPFSECFVQAACNATCDERFKSPTIQEVGSATIEITLMSDLFIPLFEEEIAAHATYENVGYVSSVENRIMGWYLPATFNTKFFPSFTNFIADLIVSKSSIHTSDQKKAEVKTFTVEDFIESEKSPLTLYGPIAHKNVPQLNKEEVEKVCAKSADWLCAITEQSGYIPPIINIQTTPRELFDQTRCSFTALALAVFATKVKNATYLKTSKAIAEYCRKRIEGAEKQKDSSLLSQAYLGQLAIVTGDTSSATLYAHDLFQHIDDLDKNIILRSQILRLHQLTGSNQERDVEKLAEEFLLKVESNSPVSLAEFAELITLTQNTKYHQQICSWYKTQQLSDGSFPNTTTSEFRYVRGTGKVLESLSMIEKTDEIIEKGFAWIQQFQYTEENMYHIPETIRKQVRGGFRHDYFNRDAWIDSAAHILIAGARYLP